MLWLVLALSRKLSPGCTKAVSAKLLKKYHCVIFNTCFPKYVTYMCVCAKSLLSLCLTLCDPMDCSLPGPSVHGVLQARIQEWVAMPTSKDLLASVGGSLPLAPPGKVKVKVTQSCPILCHPMDCTVHGIPQARILEWVAFPFSRISKPVKMDVLPLV